MTDVAGYLVSKGLTLRHATKSNVNVACPFHGEDPRKRGRLYVNVDPDADIPGLFLCHVCGEKGSLTKLKRFYGDPVGNGNDPGESHYDLFRDAADYYHQTLWQTPEALAYLHGPKRGLTDETIKRFRLGWADGKIEKHLLSRGFTIDDMKSSGLLLRNGTEFFSGVITIPYTINHVCVGLRQKELTGKYKQPAGWTQRLFNLDAAYRKPKEIILCEGEFDTMLAEQLGYAALGVPGAGQWQDHWNDYLDEARRVFVVFDNDEAGYRGAEKIKASVGDKVRVAIVPPVVGDDDANDLSAWVAEQGHTVADLNAHLAENRQSLLVSVRSARDEYEMMENVPGIKFGHRRMDMLLSPGLRPWQVAIVLAKTNVGKTLWTINTFALMAMSQPELRMLFVSLEQTRGEWFDRIQRIYAFHNQYLVPSDFNQLPQFKTTVKDATEAYWEPRFKMADVNRMSPEQLLALVDDYEEEMGEKPGVIAIDYLGYWARSFKGEEYERMTNAIMEVKAIAKEIKIPIICPHQVNRGAEFGQRFDISKARGSGAIEETADLIFNLSGVDSGTDPMGVDWPKGTVACEIGKTRAGGKDEIVHYQRGYSSLVMLPCEPNVDFLEERRLAGAEFDETNKEKPWDEVLWQHRLKMPGLGVRQNKSVSGNGAVAPLNTPKANPQP